MASRLRVYRLRCEHLEAVGGLNTPAPRFSWALSGEGRSRRQGCYRIVLATSAAFAASGNGDVWDSGDVASDRQAFVPYSGPALGSDLGLFWSVQVRDETGQRSDWAEPAALMTGIAHEEWQASWIARYFVLPAGRESPQDTDYDNRFQARPADYLRKGFSVEMPVARAHLHVTALGVYEAHLNGVRVGDHLLAPGWTDYHQRVEYQAFDVTDLIRTGANCLGAILGEGWYSGRVGHNQRRAGNHYGGRPALRAQLSLLFADGSRRILGTDESWRTTQGPICYSDLLVGERYDARLERDGWDLPGHADGDWQPAEAFEPEPAPPRIDAARAEPVRAVAELPLSLLHRLADGTMIFDCGQNLAGFVEMSLEAAAGSTFVLQHAEMLDPDGGLYRDNLRFAVAEDIYVAAGRGRETFRPHFTFHGFRYVSLKAPPDFDAATLTLRAIAIQTGAETVGEIETGSELVNRLVSNIFWSQRGNFLSVPTDCPQRDERLGWTADAQVFWRTAGYFMDVSGLLCKWMEDIADAQLPDGAYTDIAPSRPLNPYRQTAQPGAPGWGDGPVILAWLHYLRSADRDLLDRHYPRFVRWMDHIGAANPDCIRTKAVYNNYGDWLSVGPATDRSLVATAYWARVADLMSRIAGVLGKAQDAACYRQLFKRICRRFSEAFVGDDGRLASDTQTAYLLALDFGLLEGAAREAAAAHLQRKIAEANGHLQTGFLGVRHLCPVLTDIGAPARAVDLLLNETYPSWGFSIRHGATTIWERWDGWTPERGFQAKAMNSFNHYAYGAVGEWLFARLGGIDWDESDPGFATVRVRPVFDARIGWCQTRFQSPRGEIETAWSLGEDGSELTLCLPPNCRGQVHLPCPADRLRLEARPIAVGEGILDIVQAADGTCISCASGRYRFQF